MQLLAHGAAARGGDVTHNEHMRSMAERAIENAETAAQIEIKDSALRDALIRNVEQELHRAYQLAACA